jgi:protocatechuate 3,4-dioxygenase beta subunit
MNHVRSWVLASLLMLGILAGLARAQTFYGSLLGTVTDASGAAVPAASVALINTGTAQRHAIPTDGNGSYQFVNLVPGAYRLEVEKPGFKRQ